MEFIGDLESSPVMGWIIFFCVTGIVAAFISKILLQFSLGGPFKNQTAETERINDRRSQHANKKSQFEILLDGRKQDLLDMGDESVRTVSTTDSISDRIS